MKFLKAVEKYYKFQIFTDLGWSEFSWWNDALIELMAITYLLEKTGIILEGSIIWIILICAFIFFYIFGRILKATGVYDVSEYAEAKISPVEKKMLEAAEIIIRQNNEINR